MCGICGKLNFDGRPVEDEELRRMTATLDHRGPDELRTVPLGACGLGAARLAIIDLDSGSQPVSNEDETVWAAANGEIYNYRELRTSSLRSDTFSRRRAIPKSSSMPMRNTAPRWPSASKGCSPRPSGTTTGGGWC